MEKVKQSEGSKLPSLKSKSIPHLRSIKPYTTMVLSFKSSSSSVDLKPEVGVNYRQKLSKFRLNRTKPAFTPEAKSRVTLNHSVVGTCFKPIEKKETSQSGILKAKKIIRLCLLYTSPSPRDS